jgi:hypothetical protein
MIRLVGPKWVRMWYRRSKRLGLYFSITCNKPPIVPELRKKQKINILPPLISPSEDLILQGENADRYDATTTTYDQLDGRERRTRVRSE